VGGEPSVGGFLWEVGNLLLMIGVLVFASRKAVTAYLADRRRGVAQDMESAEELLGNAEARLAEWSARADRLEEEVAQIKASARKAAESEREAILAEARNTAERIRQSASGVVDRELRLARVELQREAADLAVELAAKSLREKITDQDRERLFEEFVEKVEQERAH
jgi:F-type H+-transporting ATPase subunit b